MLSFSFKINKNYAFELSGFHKIRALEDGCTLTGLDINWDRYKGDHNPKFTAMLVILNYKIIELGIYNVNHLPECPKCAGDGFGITHEGYTEKCDKCNGTGTL